MKKNNLKVMLKEYREEKRITQEELAEILEVSDKSVSKWELGNGFPSKKNLMKIAETLHVPLEALMGEEEPQESKLKKSFQFALISYCIIFAATLVMRGFREQGLYQDILSRELSEIVKITASTFGLNIFTALVPAVIIGLVFYLYVIPRQQGE